LPITRMMSPFQCQLCKHGSTNPGTVTVTLQRGATTVIIKSVPAEICENCGEYYLDEKTTEQLLSMAEEAVKNRAEVEILSFAA
jgi:YgiT-type zinc finger domain-containing protein